MSSKTGLSRRIIAWVEEHPGSLGRDIGAALGFDNSSGLLAHMVKVGQLWRAGPKMCSRLFANQAQAAASHDRLCAEAKASVRANYAARCIKDNARKVATRRAAALVRSVAGPGVTVLRSVRVTVAATPPPRFAPAPGFERVITGDWAARRECGRTAIRAA